MRAANQSIEEQQVGVAATAHGDGPAGPALNRQVERYRPWYRREGRAASGLAAVSLAIIGASAGLFAWSASSGSRTPTRAPAPRILVAHPTELAVGDVFAAHADEGDDADIPTARMASDDPVGEPVHRVVAAHGSPALRGAAAAADGYGASRCGPIARCG